MSFRRVHPPRAMRPPGSAPCALQIACYTGIVILLPSLITWVAFGPGTREFAVSAGGTSSAAVPLGSSAGSQLMGRMVFGAGTIVMWLIAGTIILYKLRRCFPRR